MRRVSWMLATPDSPMISSMKPSPNTETGQILCCACVFTILLLIYRQNRQVPLIVGQDAILRRVANPPGSRRLPISAQSLRTPDMPGP